MILDNIKNKHRYTNYYPYFKEALEYVASNNLAELEPGRYEISGDDVYVLIQEYESKSNEGRYMEAHKKYADIQIVLTGEEAIYYAMSDEGMEMHQKYSEENDCVLYATNAVNSLCALNKGDFAVFFPDELHMPCCELNGKSDVKKAVVKVRIK